LTVAGVVERRVNALWKQQRQRAGSAQNWDQYQYLMSASCPPDTLIHVRGGQWFSTGRGQYGEVPTTSFDMTDSASHGRNHTFANADWYVFFWMSIDDDGSRLYVGGGGLTEYETGGEAEEAAMATDCVQLLTNPPWDYGIPIGCVILRNNGNTSNTNQFMEIEPVNRGRSYIFKTHQSIAPRNVT
jgi:hypothetical protein